MWQEGNEVDITKSFPLQHIHSVPVTGQTWYCLNNSRDKKSLLTCFDFWGIGTRAFSVKHTRLLHLVTQGSVGGERGNWGNNGGHWWVWNIKSSCSQWTLLFGKQIGLLWVLFFLRRCVEEKVLFVRTSSLQVSPSTFCVLDLPLLLLLSQPRGGFDFAVLIHIMYFGSRTRELCGQICHEAS